MKLHFWAVLGLALALLAPCAAAEREVTLSVTGQPLSEVARLVAEQAGVPVRVESNADKVITHLDIQGTAEKVLGIVSQFAGVKLRKEGDGYVLGAKAAAPSATPAAPAITPSASIIAGIKPCVALVLAYLPAEEALAQGTGFAVGPDGLVVTNAHVIKGASRLQVNFPETGTAYTAVAVAADEDKDLAVLRVAARFENYLRLGDSDQVREGEDVAMAGFPMALELLRSGIPLHTSIAKSVVSAICTTKGILSGSPLPCIQFDAPVNPGNSGGPLFRLDTGQVIGVVQSKFAYDRFQDNGISFAIPINLLRRLLADARQNPAKAPTEPPMELVAAALPQSAPGAQATQPATQKPDELPTVTRPFDLLPAEAAPAIPDPAPAPGLLPLYGSSGRMLADEARHSLYVTDPDGNSVVLIDTEKAQILRRVFTGSKPFGLALAPDGKKLYVANSGGSEIFIYDLEQNAPAGRIPLTFRPYDLAFGPGEKLFATVAGEGRTSLRSVDLRRRVEITVGGAPLRGNALLAGTDTAEWVFAAERGADSAGLYRCGVSGKLQPADLTASGSSANGAQDLTLSADGKRLYLTTSGQHYVAVLDAADLRPLGQLEIGSAPAGTALSPDGQTAYVWHGKNHLDCFDTRTFLRTGSIPLPGAPERIAVAGEKLLVLLPGGIAVCDRSAATPPIAEK